MVKLSTELYLTPSTIYRHINLFRKCSLGFYFRETSQLRNFVKINPIRNGEITLTDVGSQFFFFTNMSFNSTRENKILAKILNVL